MKVVVSILDNKTNLNIKVDSDNKIEDLLEVLIENKLIVGSNKTIYSQRMGRNFSTQRTLRECGIQNGDELYVNTSNN